MGAGAQHPVVCRDAAASAMSASDAGKGLVLGDGLRMVECMAAQKSWCFRDEIGAGGVKLLRNRQSLPEWSISDILPGRATIGMTAY